MGKLNIAHHKSYHPYRRDNIARVQQDEEEARLKEEREEGRMRMADAEARIDLLRQRAGQKKTKKKRDEEEELNFDASQPVASTSAATLPDTLQTAEGHVNLFAPLEAAAANHASETALALIREHAKQHPTDKGKSKGKEEDGVRLAPSKLDLKPWYADEELRSAQEREQGAHEREARRAKDLSFKERRDPMKAVEEQLARRAREKGAAPIRRVHHPAPAGGKEASAADPAVAARLSRESAERQRAQALIERKRREAAVSPYPASVDSTPRAGYRDVYNADAMREVEAARRERVERVNGWERERGWERDRGRERERYWSEGAERKEVHVGRERERRW
ncbi:hypothetical protein CALVIDRAFT_539129 [Calocera viscosa TUFC12733]|uniref:CBF1-interacting co-repressor CIR N-terminal domain-containing protein n=1 Tax=Calocera viscosa (strain TUFC12733) TaxID=1330018 RepID=A0A167K8W3_CALVF|nr:hypothetical protein CALVIDRAFT_539129 [Calocera viscosa TUFC12733]